MRHWRIIPDISKKEAARRILMAKIKTGTAGIIAPEVPVFYLCTISIRFFSPF